MEINQRMSKRFAWLLGVVVLVSIGVLVACGSNYNASSDGLVLVGSQGSGLIETFSFNLNNGGSSAISNTPADTSGQVCVLKGIPSSIVVDPKGAYAYTIIDGNTCGSNTISIFVLKVNSDGTTTVVGSPVGFTEGTVTILGTTNTEQVAVVPGTMVMDPAGKFLFVADRATTDSSNLYVPGAVSVFAIGSGGTLTEVAGSPFFTSNAPTTLGQAGLDIAGVAPTPTVFPAIGLNGVQNSVCSTVGLNPPTSQYLYAVDKLGNQVFEFAVNTSTGVLTNPSSLMQEPSFGADALPVGVAVDPCNRFVYVTGSLNGRINAYTICNGGPNQSSLCPQTPDGRLEEVAGSPFSLAGSNIQAGPLVVDPFGNYVYVLGTHSNTVNILKISPVSGALSASNPATVATGLGPTSIAIRGDDNWLFVTNYNGPSVSQYSITPATGALTVLPAIQTDNYPWGVAVK
jgi:hypothetical protein